MGTPMVIINFRTLSPRDQERFNYLVGLLDGIASDRDGVGMIMTALARAGSETITEARMWLDNAETPDGHPWDSRDVIDATAGGRILGTPRLEIE